MYTCFEPPCSARSAPAFALWVEGISGAFAKTSEAKTPAHSGAAGRWISLSVSAPTYPDKNDRFARTGFVSFAGRTALVSRP